MRSLHSVAFACACAVLALAGAVLPAAPVAVQIAFAIPLILALGLPHGALDLAVAEARLGARRGLRRLRFLGAYAGSSGLVIALWCVAPVAALALFLAYAAVHFSEDWRDEARLPARLSFGVAAVVAPFLADADQVADLFEVLAGERSRTLASHVAEVAPALVGLAVVLALSEGRHHRRARLEVPALALLGLTTPPLVTFTVYFCGLHSVRHLALVGRLLARSPAKVARAALPATGAAVVLGLFASALVEGSATDRALRVTFVGLAALTVPHMIVVARLPRTR